MLFGPMLTSFVRRGPNRLKMKTIVIIPARYGSSRLPGKPLAKICGEELILHVCRNVSQTGLDFAVATDHDEIFRCVERAGYRAVMTAASHKSGTERVAEAYRLLRIKSDIIVNVQGDEPFVKPEEIIGVSAALENNPHAGIATVATRFDNAEGIAQLADPNLVKIVMTPGMEAIYFSRNVIPYDREGFESGIMSNVEYYTHVGIYAYRPETLTRIVGMPATPLEKAEKLEQLRWIENGCRIAVALTARPSLGIDTAEDLMRAEEKMQKLVGAQTR